MNAPAPLAEIDLVRHGFCGSVGGVSEGIYASLNCGFGSGDDPARVAENRSRAAAQAGVDPAGTRHRLSDPQHPRRCWSSGPGRGGMPRRSTPW